MSFDRLSWLLLPACQSGYRAIGYARGDSLVDPTSISDEPSVKYDGEPGNGTDFG